jgi:hypothetical protein
MHRPRRAAAQMALEKIQRVREWEEMPENSKRFRECAAQIEREFRSEEIHRRVRPEDLPQEEHGCSSEEEYHEAKEDFEDANSFVSEDCESETSEYRPSAEQMAEVDDDDDGESLSSATETDEDTELHSDEDTETEAAIETTAYDTEEDTQASQATTATQTVADTDASEADTLIAADYTFT